jgi:hypothetical protein
MIPPRFRVRIGVVMLAILFVLGMLAARFAV